MRMAAGSERLGPVTKEAYDGWHRFAYQHGADVTALAEVVGLHLARMTGPIDKVPAQWRRMAEEAAALKKSRASRKAR